MQSPTEVLHSGRVSLSECDNGFDSSTVIDATKDVSSVMVSAESCANVLNTSYDDSVYAEDSEAWV